MSLCQFCGFEGQFRLGNQSLYTWILGCKFWAFALCNQLNQRDQLDLIKAHPFLLISYNICQSTQCTFKVSQLVRIIFVQNKIQKLLVRASFEIKLFSLFISIVLHLFNSVLLFSCSNFHCSSIGDDYGRLNN